MPSSDVPLAVTLITHNFDGYPRTPPSPRMVKKNPPAVECRRVFRGADGNRNHDLFDANEALYQLSYSPLDVTLLRKATRNNIVRSAVKRNLTPKCRTRVDTVTFRCRRRGKSPTPLRMDTAAAPGNVITSPARPAPSFRCRTRTRCRPDRTARPRTRRRCGSPRRTPCRWWRRR